MSSYVQQWPSSPELGCPVCGSDMIAACYGPSGGFTPYILTCGSSDCHWTGSIEGGPQPETSRRIKQQYHDDLNDPFLKPYQKPPQPRKEPQP